MGSEQPTLRTWDGMNESEALLAVDGGGKWVEAAEAMAVIGNLMMRLVITEGERDKARRDALTEAIDVCRNRARAVAADKDSNPRMDVVHKTSLLLAQRIQLLRDGGGGSILRRKEYEQQHMEGDDGF